MERRNTSVKNAYPIGDNGLNFVPDHLDVQRQIAEEDIILYKPLSFIAVTKEPMSKITYSKLSEALVIDSIEIDDPESRSRDAQATQHTLSHVSNLFWPVAVGVFQRLVGVPKRDNGFYKNITPDMGLIPSKPKRKPDAPRLTQKPTPKSS